MLPKGDSRVPVLKESYCNTVPVTHPERICPVPFLEIYLLPCPFPWCISSSFLRAFPPPHGLH